MIIKKILFFILFIFVSLLIFSNEIITSKNKKEYKNKLILFYIDNVFFKDIRFKEFIFSPDAPCAQFDFLNFALANSIQNTELKKTENPIRRAEILFFGSLTFVTFGGWLFFSIYNILIYNETFGQLRREQFIPLYLGGSIISFSVVISDLFINLKPKFKKNIEIY